MFIVWSLWMLATSHPDLPVLEPGDICAPGNNINSTFHIRPALHHPTVSYRVPYGHTHGGRFGSADAIQKP